MENSQHLFRTMGTEAYLEIVHDPRSAEHAKESIAKAVNLCFEKVKIFNRFDPESEISILNQNLGTYRTASPDLLAVTRHSLEFFRESKGLFDPRVIGILKKIGYHEDFESWRTVRRVLPEIHGLLSQHRPLSFDLKVRDEFVFLRQQMDFSGIAKGYILDRMANSIMSDGWDNFLIDAGGDIVARGVNRDGRTWRISVENVPESEFVASLSSQAIATSGVTRRHWKSVDGTRFHHLVNPKHPQRFDFDILSASVVAENAERADFLAKTLFLMGVDDGLQYAEKHGIPALFVNEDRKISRSSLFTSEKEKINKSTTL